MRVSRDQLGGLLLLVFSTAYAILSFDIPILEGQHAQFNARSMPHALAAISIVLALGLMLKPTDPQPLPANMRWYLGIMFLLLMSAYGWALRPIGFITATFFFLAGGFMLLGERRALVISAVALLTTMAFWALMTQLLGVHIEALPASFPGIKHG